MKTGYKVQDVMTTVPIKVEKSTSLKEAAQLMAKFNINSLVVIEENKLVGVVTDEDFVRKLVAKWDHPKDEATISQIMSTDLVTIEPHRDIYQALVVMRDNAIRQLPVLEGDKLVGFLTQKDILKIQPELFDIVVESLELREEGRKIKGVLDEDEAI